MAWYRRNLVEAGTTYFPASQITDNSLQRAFVGDIDPKTLAGAVFQNGDRWYSTSLAPPPEPPPDQPTYGAATLGTTTYTIPAGAKYVDSTGGSDGGAGTIGDPYATVEHAVTVLASSGGTIVVRAGTYHEQFVSGSTGNPVTIQAYPNEVVWFDGSVVVSAWTQVGGVWVHTGVPTQFSRANGTGGSLPTSYLGTDPNAGLSDQVWYDGARLTQIADGATPAAGQFSVNYGANTITIGSTPVGHTVRVSDLRYLCVANKRINWLGMGVRRYSPDSTNARRAPFYYGGNSGGALFENMDISWSAMASMSLNSHNITIRNCSIHDNMWQGFGGTTCDGMVIEACEIYDNNQGHFLTAPETGAIKITHMRSPVIKNNYIHDNNNSNGIWIDESITDYTIVGNVITGSHRHGMLLEDSDGILVPGGAFPNETGARSARSVCAGNLVSTTGMYGITLWATGYTDVYNNEVSGGQTAYAICVQKDRNDNVNNVGLPGTECPWVSYDNHVCNNIINPTSSGTVKFAYFDSFHVPPDSADTMLGVLSTNQFVGTSGTGSVIRWGNNTTPPGYTSYNVISTFAAAHPSAQGAGNKISTSGYLADSATTAMPANVASALGVATGTKKLGPYVTAP